MSKNTDLIPRSIEECYETDEITGALLSWSVQIKKWGLVFAVATCICGLIAAIGAATAADEDFAFFITIVPYILSAFGEMLAFHFLSFIIHVVASFHENSAITANVALYRAAREEGYFAETNSARGVHPEVGRE